MADDAIALKVQTPDSFKTIGEMLGAANASQQYKRQGVALEQERALLQPNIEKGEAESKQAQIAANLAQFRLKGEQAQKVRNILTGLQADPDFKNGNVEGMLPKIAQARQQSIDSGVPPQVAEVQFAPLMTMTAHDPKGVRQFLINTIRGGQGAQEQAAVVNAPLTPVPTGQTITPTQFQPGAPGFTGQPVQMQLPPSTEVVDPHTGAKKLLGPQGQGGPQTSLPVGQPEAIAGTVDAMNKDFESTRQTAQTASQDIGVLQNIKKYAKGAITGVESDKRAYMEGLSGLTGIPSAQLAKTSTDLLAKNANMLALVGGNTDAARILAEGANPNTHMTPEAIEKAADQVIGQRRIALEKQKFLQPIKAAVDRGDAPASTYNSALARWNQNSDPRVLQLRDMSKEDKIKMMNAMSPAERKEFIAKVRGLHQLGVAGE